LTSGRTRPQRAGSSPRTQVQLQSQSERPRAIAGSTLRA
jgi:hypothetical protein